LESKTYPEVVASFWFPRAGVGTQSGRARVRFYKLIATLARRDCIPTPARGNDKTANSLIDIEKFDAQGHRGGRNLRPENTLPAMEVGLDHLMTTLETDIGITKDGIPVLTHEPYIEEKLCRRAESKKYLALANCAKAKALDSNETIDGDFKCF
jgi:hypothetical protein